MDGKYKTKKIVTKTFSSQHVHDFELRLRCLLLAHVERRVSSHLDKQGRGDMGDEELRAAMLIPVMGTQGDTVHL